MKIPSTKTVIKLSIKLVISGGLIAWVFASQVNFPEIRNVIRHIDMTLLVLAFLMIPPGILISALRWKKLLEFQGVHVRLLSLVDSYLVGLFFNNFLPTRVGGDVVRAADLRHASQSIYKSASTIFVERFLGITVLLFFALCASVIKLPLAREIPTIWVGLALGILGMAMCFLTFYSRIVERLIQFIPMAETREKMVNRWSIFQNEVLSLVMHKKPVLWGTYYSTLLQLVVIIHYWVIGMAFGFDIPLLDYFFLIPIQQVILMLPSINGIGLREASCILLFNAYGIGGTEATMFGLVDFLMRLLAGLVGGARFIVRRSLPEALDGPTSR